MLAFQCYKQSTLKTTLKLVHTKSIRQATYPMICLEVIDLLLEEDGPQIFAEEFDHVQIVKEARAVARESGQKSVQALINGAMVPVDRL